MIKNLRLQEMYKSSFEKVRGVYAPNTGSEVFKPYIDFVLSCEDGRGALLDVGCGDGSSTHALAEQGFVATGIDLNKNAFQPSDRCALLEGTALALPFADAFFDVVCVHQAIEHMPDPLKALDEMVRVLKPGGLICVIGPNLLSLGMSIKALTFYVWLNRPISRAFRRTPGMPVHPFGNTVFECMRLFFSNSKQIVRKFFDRNPTFTMREPDLTPPFHADNDACYVCNPIDLKKYFQTKGFKIVRDRPKGRPAFMTLLAGGTWIAARSAEPTRASEV